MKRFLTLSLLALAMGAACAQSGTVYKWKDAQGKWQFSDSPPLKGSAETVRKDALAEPGDPNAGAAKLFPVLVYMNACGETCDTAKAWLQRSKVPYSLRDPTDPKIFPEFKLRSPQGLSPAMVVGERVVVGFDMARWQSALTEVGYTLSPAAPAAR